MIGYYTYALYQAQDTRTNKGEIMLVLHEDTHACRKLEKEMQFGGYRLVGQMVTELDEVHVRSGIGYKVEQENHQLSTLLARVQSTVGFGVKE